MADSASPLDVHLTAEVQQGRSPDQVDRSSLSHQIAERLRNDIVQGRLAAGTRLVQDELCERFGTSRMPVRDALRQLTHEGLLQEWGQHRIVVQLGAEDLREALAIIAVLHGWAAGRVAEIATEEEMDELEAACDAALSVDDPYEFAQLGMQFHRKINFLAHSPRLIRTLIGIQQSVPRTLPFIIPEEMVPSGNRFRSIVAAIRDRNSQLAEQLTRDNLLVGVELLVRSLDLAKGQDGIGSSTA